MGNLRRTFSELVFFAVAAISAVPLWLVEWPPIQDLPQHLAAVRVLADYDEPALRFAEHFTIELSRTQYLAYYLVARVLAVPFGALVANKLLISAALVGAPYAMRFLLSALGRDWRPAYFVVALAWNAHLVLGFLNFIAAIPLCLVGLGHAVLLRRRWTGLRAAVLAAIALVTFYTHVVPFGFLFLGAALVGAGDGVVWTAKRWLPLVPSALAALVWSQKSPAGRATAAAARLREAPGAPEPRFETVAENLHRAPSWVTDVLRADADDWVLVAWAGLALACFALAPLEQRSAASRAETTSRVRIGLLAPLALVLYFALPSSFDWIWPINARFALLALLFLIVSIPAPERLAGAMVFSAVASLALYSSAEVGAAFRRFEREEVGDFDEAVAVVPEGSRVVGLVFERESAHVKFSPFLHSAAMLQAKRGGAAMFTFMDFPPSPVRFRERDRPARVAPRWEWMPDRVDPRRDLEWFDYALVRGGPGRIGATRDRWEPLYEGHRWRVYRRTE